MKDIITFISYNKLTYYGGEQKWIIDLANKLVDYGYSVKVITPSVVLPNEKERISLEHLKNIIKFEYILCNKFFLKYKGFREYFVFVNTDFVYLSDFWASLIQQFISKKIYKIIAGNHGLLFAPDFKGQRYKLHLLRILSPIFRNMSNLVIHVLNTKQKNYYTNLGYRRVILLQNFIHSYKYNINFSIEKFPVIFIGRFVEQKGIDILLEIIKPCIKNLEDVVFWIVGSGDPKYEKIIRLIEKKYPNRIRYFGFVPESMKIELLSKSNLFLAPSRFEGQPIAVLEALASGCPFIGSNIVAYRDLINLFDRDFGWIVNKYSPEEFAKKIMNIYRIWDENPTVYYRRRKKIFEKARKIFDIDIVIKLFIKYFLK